VDAISNVVAADSPERLLTVERVLDAARELTLDAGLYLCNVQSKE
jgi:hypothetical protein